MSAVAVIPQLMRCGVPDHRQRGPVGYGNRDLRRLESCAGMNQTAQRAGSVVNMLAGWVGLAVGRAACRVADRDTAESRQGIR